MNKVILIAIREFKATALTPAFIFGAIILPFLIGAVLFVAGAAGLFSQTPEPTVGDVALIDPTADHSLTETVSSRLHPDALKAKMDAQREAAQRQLQELYGDLPLQGQADDALARAFGASPAQITVHRIEPDADAESLKEQVRAGDFLALVEVSDDTFSPGGRFSMFTGDSAKARDIDLIRNAVADSVVDLRLADAGMSAPLVRTLSQRPRSDTRTITATGETGGSEAFLRFLPLIFFMFLAIAILTGGGYLLMSTVEEKASRIMEVLLSAMSPMQLMTGKIIGQGFVGLALLLIYSALGIVAAIQFDMFQLVPTHLLVWLVVYFFMGYFIYAGINAAIGAAVNEAREAQSLQGPIMGVTILVMYLAIFSTMFSDNPHSTLAVGLSFFPPATPFVMAMRMGYIGESIPMWQLVSTTAVGFGGMLLSVWVAAKIFRVGVLMYGQPPSLIGLFKWLRYT